MVEAKHKLREVKKKTIFDRLKGSAWFVLFIIILFIVDVVSFIFWLSGLLSSRLTGSQIFTDGSFVLFVGLAAGLAVFLGLAWLVQRRVHGA